MSEERPGGRSRIRLLGSVVLVAALVASACRASATGNDDTAASNASTGSTIDTGDHRLVAADGLRVILDREHASRRGSSTPTTIEATTSASPSPAVSAVGVISATFVDTTRGTPARGGTPAQSTRTMTTTIYYPSAIAPSTAMPEAPAAAGRYPLVVFAHGFAIDAASYAPLLRDLAMGGYVVAAPDFPGTSTAYPGPAIREDSLEQPHDISFVITSMLQPATQPEVLQHTIDPIAIGVSGQSDGAVTATATGYNTCCLDPRIRAGVMLTGTTFGFPGTWFPPGTPPVMFVHATADEINDYSASVSMFERAQSPKNLLTIEGGSHLEVYVDPPWEPHVASATVAFLDQYLKADPTGAGRLLIVGNQPGFMSLRQG